MNKKHILLSVGGLTPAIITETLACLWKEKKVYGGEIHIITTEYGKYGPPPMNGKDKRPGLLDILAGENGKVAEFNRVYSNYSRTLGEPEVAWEIREEWIRVILDRNGASVTDLLTLEQNAFAADAILAAVREWTGRDDVIVHASLAGGRKTMAPLLQQAMSWYARPDDDLSHVLVPEALERTGSVYFPDPFEPGALEGLSFAEQPFVRMPDLLPRQLKESAMAYADLVAQSEVFLRDILTKGEKSGDLFLERRKQSKGQTAWTLFLEGMEVAHLTAMDLGIYLFLFEHANLARNQAPLDCGDLDGKVDALADCLRRAKVVGSRASLSSLANPNKREWNPIWLSRDNREHEEHRKTDLLAASNHLIGAFEHLPQGLSFLVRKSLDEKTATRNSSCRYVDIRPDKLSGIPA